MLPCSLPELHIYYNYMLYLDVLYLDDSSVWLQTRLCTDIAHRKTWFSYEYWWWTVEENKINEDDLMSINIINNINLHLLNLPRDIRQFFPSFVFTMFEFGLLPWVNPFYHLLWPKSGNKLGVCCAKLSLSFAQLRYASFAGCNPSL